MTSRHSPTIVFPTVRKLQSVLESLVWPTLLSSTGENLNTFGVSVMFGEIMGELPERETVAVTGSVTDDDQSTWSQKGLNTKGESFTTTIVVVTNVPNRSGEEAWDRLEELVSTIDGALRLLDGNGRPIVPVELALLGVYSWSVSSVATACYPIIGHGHVAHADVDISVFADI